MQGADADDLDGVLAALANRHRRAIVYQLGLQPYSIAHLAKMRGLSLPAIHKHIAVLENANMILRRKTGRTNYLILNRESLHELQEWITQFTPGWGSDEQTLENYVAFLDGNSNQNSENETEEKG